MEIAVGGSKRGTISEMDVVPLIDVLLVLLVTFMIIPHTQTGLKAQIPRPAESASPAISEPEVLVRSGAGRRIVETQSAAGEVGSSAQPVAGSI
jgi:biopolymer transport protein TolR